MFKLDEYKTYISDFSVILCFVLFGYSVHMGSLNIFYLFLVSFLLLITEVKRYAMFCIVFTVLFINVMSIQYYNLFRVIIIFLIILTLFFI